MTPARFAAAALALATGGLAAQSPRAANPERPTVATHAYAVAPGFVELEQGVKLSGEARLRDVTLWEFNLKLGLARDVQLGFFGTGYGRTPAGAGVGDVGWALKWTRPVGRRSAVAVVPAVSVPTGDAAAQLSAGRALGSVTLVDSADLPAGLGGLHFDANTGPAGVGAGAGGPQWFTSLGLAKQLGSLAIATELFDFTAGAAGGRQRGLLVSLLVTAAEWAVLDLGGVWGLAAGSPDQAFVGLTTNLGRLFR
jgi:hypothetical protein